ncbi:hypothetical protein HHI36_009506, partial [Cryptolaemus montrouzieri]
VQEEEMVNSLKQYFETRKSALHLAVRRNNLDFSPLCLSEPYIEGKVEVQARLKREWMSKELHDKYPANLGGGCADRSGSSNFLRAGYLFPETEDRMLAVQVLKTRAHL